MHLDAVQPEADFVSGDEHAACLLPLEASTAVRVIVLKEIEFFTDRELS